MGTAPDAVKRLVDLFDRERKVYQSPDYKEEQLRAPVPAIRRSTFVARTFLVPVIHEESINACPSVDVLRLTRVRFRATTYAATQEKEMTNFKIIVERHSDGYVAYPLGLKGVVVGEGDTYEAALTDVKSAIRFHLDTFGEDALDADSAVLEAYVTDEAVAV